MWKNFFTYLQSVMTLAKDVERLDDGYKRLDERMEFKIQLLEMERRLLSAKPPENQK
ncbi:MAG: hypothetical protein ACREAB_09690 [Blastocatellia bacterium]